MDCVHGHPVSRGTGEGRGLDWKLGNGDPERVRATDCIRARIAAERA